MTAALAWGVVALLAVVWPSRIIGPLDGAPLDTAAEVILVGVVFPIAWMLYPRVFNATTPRVLTGLLAAWKLATWLLLTQQGLCATFAIATGLPDHQVLRRSWDFRTPVHEGLPQCSAVLARSLHAREEFPAWFVNLPLGDDHDLSTGTPRRVELTPGSDVRLHVVGYVASDSNIREVDQSVSLAASGWRYEMPYASGLFGGERATIAPPTALDRLAGRLWFVTPLLVITLIGGLVWRAFARLRLPVRETAALAALTAACAVSGGLGEPYARLGILLLPVALALRLPSRLQGPRGIVVVIGVPLLALLLGAHGAEIGRFTLYSAGDDWQTFQRFAARIYFEGFWLEGGEQTFWQQPLYRWIAGLLHVIFGDSSIGEVIWDGFGLIALASLGYVLVRRYAPERWALGAAIATLVTTLLGPNWYLVGRGLSEISGAMWLAIASFALLRAQHGHVRAAAVAGAFATLAIYTRLNHLILAMGLMVLLLPPVSTRTWAVPVALLKSLSARAALLYGAMLGGGVLLFATRTWYYTGHFSLLYGTTRQFNSTGLGLDTITEPAVWARVLDSVLMVVTVSDPPRFDPRSVLVIAGVAVAVLALLRLPIVRDVPLAPAALCLVAISSAFIARGLAYPGRFSLHLIPLAVAVSVLFAARLTGQVRVQHL